jgi:UDP-N-acetylglucosamine 2-epimerase (hydrolysing)
MARKKILFLTGTRADFGKLKSLIKITQKNKNFLSEILVTGMHLQKEYGETIVEIYKSNIENIFSFENHHDPKMDIVLAETIKGVSNHIHYSKPDLIVVHGDRVEALAGAIAGSLNNILVAHIEGGELSGTVDEIIRHAVSKMSHIHFVSNEEAKKRLIQLGEVDKHIFIIGSPDLDLMNPDNLPSIDSVKKYYEIDFDAYSIMMYHPVTTEIDSLEKNIDIVVNALEKVDEKFIVIFPNNDLGTEVIISRINKLHKNKKFKIFPSLRFEYFLTLLNNAEYIIGNSSAGIREAPFYNVPSINIGTRQHGRGKDGSIINCEHNIQEIIQAIKSLEHLERSGKKNSSNFGDGKSDINFIEILLDKIIWQTSNQKYFQDLK